MTIYHQGVQFLCFSFQALPAEMTSHHQADFSHLRPCSGMQNNSIIKYLSNLSETKQGREGTQSVQLVHQFLILNSTTYKIQMTTKTCKIK